MRRRSFGSIRTLPSGRFQARWKDLDGTARRQVVDTLWEAEDLLDAVAAQQQATRDAVAAGLPDAAAVDTSFAGFTASWLRTRPLEVSTLNLYIRHVQARLLPAFGHLELTEITPALVREWYARPDAPTQRAQAYRLLRAILNTAVEDDAIPANPCRIKNAGSGPTPREAHPPTLAEIAALIDGCRGDVRRARWAAFFAVAAYGGLRFEELLGLRRCDLTITDTGIEVAVSHAVVRVGGQWVSKPTKSRAGQRTVALPASLRPLLDEHLDRWVRAGEQAALFRTATGKIPFNAAVNQLLTRASQQYVGRSDFSLHDLRHAAATTAAQAGATTREVMARIGHASPRAALIYQHATRDRDREIAAALDEAIKAGGPSLRIVG